MEILKRAKTGGEIVAFNESESNVREEVNRRTYKAGLTNSEGGPPITGNIRSMSFTKQGRENYDKIDWSKRS